MTKEPFRCSRPSCQKQTKKKALLFQPRYRIQLGRPLDPDDPVRVGVLALAAEGELGLGDALVSHRVYPFCSVGKV